MPKIELDNFYNDGFGWICKHCERELKMQEKSSDIYKHSRLMREGEAESKQPNFSNSALAKWFDNVQTTLICPRCGLTERLEQ
jgi:hypothetical protein